MMRIFVGSLQQEVNSFSLTPGVMEDFDFIEGPAMLQKIAAAKVFEREGAEVAPSYYANAVPSGKLPRDVFLQLVDKMVSYAKHSGPFDGVWLYLHGAMDIDGVGSGEVALLKALREATGYDAPYAVALDFHANNDPDIVKYANIICGYRTAPHSDMPQTQIKAAELLMRAVKSKILPRSVMATIPAIMTGDMVITANHPMDKVLKRLDAIEQNDGEVMSISFFNGHNWVDGPNNRASVIATVKSDVTKGLMYAREIAEFYWSVKGEIKFMIEALPPDAALGRSAECAERPCFVSDSGDNTTAGAPGDGAYLLREAIKLGMRDTAFGGIFDKAAYATCVRAGIGGAADILLGSCSAERYEPLPLTVTVQSLHTLLGWDGEDAGGAALVRTGGIDIIITEGRTAFTTPEIFLSAGVDISKYKTVAVKLGYLYPKLAEAAGRAILATTPGVSCIDVKALKFTKIERPVYPIDDGFTPRFEEYGG